jgi:hypothetical protein
VSFFQHVKLKDRVALQNILNKLEDAADPVCLLIYLVLSVGGQQSQVGAVFVSLCV